MKNLQQEFLEKIESHKGMIFKVSKMYVDHQEDREDLFQEIIYQLWKSGTWLLFSDRLKLEY